MKSRFFLACAVSAAILCFSALGSADDIKVDYNHHTDFASYHTYSWSTIHVSNQFNADRIRRAVDKLLKQDGWKEVASGGQVTIMATDNIHSEQEAESYYTGMGGGWGGGWGWGGWGGGSLGGFGDETTTTVDVRSAHVVIDIFDSSSKDLLWRGVSRGELSNKSTANRKRLFEDIDHMFKNFPPKASN
jgi:hypothetical protein